MMIAAGGPGWAAQAWAGKIAASNWIHEWGDGVQCAMRNAQCTAHRRWLWRPPHEMNETRQDETTGACAFGGLSILCINTV